MPEPATSKRSRARSRCDTIGKMQPDMRSAPQPAIAISISRVNRGLEGCPGRRSQQFRRRIGQVFSLEGFGSAPRLLSQRAQFVGLEARFILGLDGRIRGAPSPQASEGPHFLGAEPWVAVHAISFGQFVGLCRFLGLSPGAYALEASLEGFSTVNYPKISINVGRNAALAAGFPESVCGTSVDRQCGSSQQSLHFAAQGVMAGYFSLWSVYWVFKQLTGKEGMGYGDFKLLAAIGAWVGLKGILPTILLSSVVGAIVGSAWLFAKGRDRATPIPFGPYLAIAGWIAFFWSGPLIDGYLRLTGLQ